MDFIIGVISFPIDLSLKLLGVKGATVFYAVIIISLCVRWIRKLI